MFRHISFRAAFYGTDLVQIFLGCSFYFARKGRDEREKKGLRDM